MSLIVRVFLFAPSVLAKEAISNKVENPKEIPAKAKIVAKPADPLASSINRHSLGVGLGQTFLGGHFQDHGSDAISLDLFYEYSASYSFDFLANFHYSKHKDRSQYVTLPGLTASIKAKFFQFDNFSPFAVGGLGFYRPKANRLIDNVLTDSSGKITFGWNLGAGADLKLNSSARIGLLGIIHNPFDIKQDLGPDVEGSYFKIMLTAMYTF